MQPKSIFFLLFSFIAFLNAFSQDAPRADGSTNVFWDAKSTLHFYWSNEIISPDQYGKYNLWAAKNEEPTQHFMEDIGSVTIYKFKNYDACFSFCNCRRKILGEPLLKSNNPDSEYAIGDNSGNVSRNETDEIFHNIQNSSIDSLPFGAVTIKPNPLMVQKHRHKGWTNLTEKDIVYKDSTLYSGVLFNKENFSGEITYLSDIAHVTKGRLDSMMSYFSDGKLKYKQISKGKYFTYEHYYPTGQLWGRYTVSYIEPYTDEWRYLMHTEGHNTIKEYAAFGESESYNRDGTPYKIGKFIDKNKGSYLYIEYEKGLIKKQVEFTGVKRKWADGEGNSWDYYEKYYENGVLKKSYSYLKGVNKELSVTNTVQQNTGYTTSNKENLNTKKEKRACYVCNGAGITACSNRTNPYGGRCVNGRQYCKKCEGRGKFRDGKTCLNCAGSGFVACNECKGNTNYKRKCSRCNGAKYIVW